MPAPERVLSDIGRQLIDDMATNSREGIIAEVLFVIDTLLASITIEKRVDGFRLLVDTEALDTYGRWFSSPGELVNHLHDIVAGYKWFNRRLLSREEYSRAVTLYQTLEQFGGDSEEDDLCPICLERAYGLRLNCGHRLCGICLNKLVTRLGAVMSCPTCRSVHMERHIVNRNDD